MVLNIKDKWNTLEDYFSDLRKNIEKNNQYYEKNS